MVPILFSATETDFTHNGLGRLTEAISCSVTEERNGIYELELTYPVSGHLYSTIINGGIVGVIHDDNHDVQAFDIYKHTAPIDGIVTFYAHHISYRLTHVITTPFSAATAAAAIAGVTSHSTPASLFALSTDIVSSSSFALEQMASARGALLGEEGSILQTYGGEFLFDNFNVSLLAMRGVDNGVTVRYGKNLTGIEWERDISGTYNAVAPFWADANGTVTLPEVYVQPTTPINPAVPMVLDMTSYFKKKPTVAQLRTKAIQYLDTNRPWRGIDTITVDFAALWQTPEYADVADIQRVGLCDIVSIYDTRLGVISEKAEVVRVVFDVLAERFTEIQVGTIINSFVAVTDSVTGATPTIAAGGGRVLLWQNTSPTSNFTAQTVSVDLSTFDYAEIVYVAAAAAQNYYPPTIAPIGETASMDAWTSIGTSGQAILHRHRTADVSASGVTFGACEQKRTNVTTASTTDNSGCIPIQIFGVRL